MDRASSVKVNNSCLPRTHTKNSLKIGQKMSCVAEITEPGIIYLLEESIQKLPKIEGNLEDDHVLKNLCTMTGEHVKTLSGKNGYSMTQAPSTMASNAMELLNLINIKCTHLNKLGDDLRIEDMDHQRKHNGGRDGQPKMVEDEIQISDLLTLASANKPQKFWNSPNINGDLICEEHNLSTRAEESSVERVENQTGESSLQSISTDYGGCIQKTPRKQPTPRKGVENLDPSFKGIEFQMHLCFGKEKCDDCQLIVTSCYSRGRSRRKSIKSRLRFKSTSLSSGSEDDHLPAPSSRSKQCASCKTQKTPLWRDAEDGTPLCNACGIRYKKYGLKCGRCWNIPKRDGKSCSKYCGCGGIFV
ncbi:GATA-type zinc finger protein 1 isoform X2 [Dendrobates tinctorius]|uniref:GATA-type zinc finger protein 1 isoform X2 n=1 Tax=Dendrobates tinctorius TaxID=92724 RepID=UPI003CC953D0